MTLEQEVEKETEGTFVVSHYLQQRPFDIDMSMKLKKKRKAWNDKSAFESVPVEVTNTSSEKEKSFWSFAVILGRKEDRRGWKRDSLKKSFDEQRYDYYSDVCVSNHRV
jgi:dTDP-4-amino-4,6-dideoxygalactose transaminase